MYIPNTLTCLTVMYIYVDDFDVCNLILCSTIAGDEPIMVMDGSFTWPQCYVIHTQLVYVMFSLILTCLNQCTPCICPRLSDMGNGQVDDSLQIMTAQQPALNTTNLIYSQIDQTDLVLHIGDISYARGYASVVSQGGPRTTCGIRAHHPMH